jgi:hypothetical protein
MFDVPLKEAESRSVDQSPYGAHMEIGTYGDLNSLYWAENEKPNHPDMILVGVTYGKFLAGLPCPTPAKVSGWFSS